MTRKAKTIKCLSWKKRLPDMLSSCPGTVHTGWKSQCLCSRAPLGEQFAWATSRQVIFLYNYSGNAFSFMHTSKKSEAIVAVVHHDILLLYPNLELTILIILTANERRPYEIYKDSTRSSIFNLLFQELVGDLRSAASLLPFPAGSYSHANSSGSHF